MNDEKKKRFALNAFSFIKTYTVVSKAHIVVY